MKQRLDLRTALAWVFAIAGVLFLIAAIVISVRSANATATQIQRERAHNILVNCEAVNARHDETIKRLDELIAAMPPERRVLAARARPGTVLLINALAPKHDNCRALMKSQVRTGV